MKANKILKNKRNKSFIVKPIRHIEGGRGKEAELWGGRHKLGGRKLCQILGGEGGGGFGGVKMCKIYSQVPFSCPPPSLPPPGGYPNN